MELDLRSYLVPLAICTKVIKFEPPVVEISIDRYVGVAFHVDSTALIATCGHIVDSMKDGEALFGQDLHTGKLVEILCIKRHQKFDFATGIFPRKNFKYFELSDKIFLPGYDVQASGFINNGRDGTDIKVSTRLFKGHIVSSSEDPSCLDARSKQEISFPSHKGFSGTPLICSKSHTLVGMLFSNSESSIETYKYVDVGDDGKVFAESIHRIVELGLFHSNRDLLSFLADLKT